MSTPVEIEQQIEELNQILDQLNNAETISATQFRAADKTYTRAQLQKEISVVTRDIKALEKVVKPYRDARNKLQSASATGPGQALTATQRRIVANAQSEVNRLAAATVSVPALSSRFAKTARRGAPITAENPVVERARTVTPVVTQPATTTQQQTTTTTTPVETPATTTTTTRTGRTTTTTRTGRTGRTATAPAAETVVVDGRRVQVGGERWKDIIQQEFGSLWDVYSSNADVKKVVDKSVKEGWFNDETKLTASLTNTSWFRTTQQSARQFAIRMSTDPAQTESQIAAEAESLRASTSATGIAFDDATLRRLATDKIKFGWSSVQISNAIGSEAIALAQLGGARGIADLRQGVVARQLREKAAAYAQKPSESQIDTWTREIMTGKKSETQWEDLMRDSARTQFRSLQPALDKGQDVETALYAYKQQAQATLGSSIDVSSIDWTSDKWNKALNYKDEKTNEYRQMDLWEWNRYLRTLPEWQNTDEAKDAYRNVAFALAQGFGKMA